MTGAMSLEELSRQMQAMQGEMTAAASGLEQSEVSRTVGGVTVTMSGTGELRAVRIDAAVVKDVSTLERQIVEASQAASAEIREAADAKLAPLRSFVAQVTNGWSA